MCAFLARRFARSPYLDDRRLEDVIAALQVLGAFVWANPEIKDLAHQLGAPLSASTWGEIFKQHPEFFRVEGDRASLRWRYAFDRSIDIDSGTPITRPQFLSMTDEQKKRIARPVLGADQIEALVKTATELHARAIAHEQERRWLTPLLFSFLTALLAALFNALFSHYLKP